ncbi:MAG TPA: Gfo/Idh/MocA family oxidoreductase [Casimicrobiaceae bacterium]
MERVLRLGAVGLGRAFTLMLPTFVTDPRIALVAAADPRAEARTQFEREFGGRSYASVEALCDDEDVDVVYIATPHQFHAEHVTIAARRGKHALVEKPMALTLAECAAMIDAADRAGVRLVVGHSHSFDAPVRRAREIVERATYVDVRMIAALQYTDFLYRPRRPEELVTAQGGGVVFSQAAHQVDIARLLGGGRLTRVRAQTGAWDRTRATEGSYAALLEFADGAFASLVYSGFAHFDSDALVDWIGELGQAKDPSHYGRARRALAGGTTPTEEVARKNERAYGGERKHDAPAVAHNHFGLVIASCDGADLRPVPNGVMIDDDERSFLDPIAAPTVPRIEVIDELYAAVVHDVPPLHDGAWAMATLEACLAILESARSGDAVQLRHQVGVHRR